MAKSLTPFDQVAVCTEPADVAEWIARSFVEWASTRSNLTAAQVTKPLSSSLHYLHDGCPEGDSAVHMLIQCTPILVEKTDVAPDVTLRFTVCKQVRMQARELPWL